MVSPQCSANQESPAFTHGECQLKGGYKVTKKQKRFFDVARAVSKTSDHPKVRIGCCIVKKRRILSVGVNLMKSHPMQKKYNKYRELTMDVNHIHNNIHAEFDAVLKANPDELVGADIYVYREDFWGKRSLCRPCEACMRLLKSRKIKAVYYTGYNSFHKEEL